ncbi:MAG: CHAP domain-containing protein [Chloroflexi bacterium]|nr:CHAP domain-containing protein [Chloroflexota bacterium]MBP8054723.1 CHAP domain-containing protein [Chloroflexota bacterium]
MKTIRFRVFFMFLLLFLLFLSITRGLSAQNNFEGDDLSQTPEFFDESQPVAWQTFLEPGFGYQLSLPKEWYVALVADNTERTFGYGEQVALRSVGFFAPNRQIIFVDVWHNQSGYSLAEWVEKYPLVGTEGSNVVITNSWGTLNGLETIQTIVSSDHSPWTYSTRFMYEDLIFNIEYVSLDPNPFLYSTVLSSIQFVSPTQTRYAKSLLTTELPPATYGTNVQTCCGITDPEYNPFPCNGPSNGNCTWWVRYSRLGDTTANLTHCTGDANTWVTCALTYYPQLVSNTPQANSVIAWTNPGDNHVAYIEYMINSTQYRVSQMGWTQPCPESYYNQNHNSALKYIHHPNTNQPPNLPMLAYPLNNTWTKSTLLQWTAGSDDGQPNSDPDFWVQVDNNSDFSSPEYDTGWGYPITSTQASLAVDDDYYWRVNQGDGELSSGWTASWLFRLDRAIPYANCVPTGTLGSNGWYISNVNVACSAIDNTGTNNSGIATTSYKLNGVTQLSSFTATENRRNLVEFSATDNAGNSRMGSFFVNIDRTSPTIASMAINNGVSTTYSANVLLNNSAYDPPSNVNDLPSDLWQTCASLDQVNWSCTEYGTAMPFSLPNNNQTTHTVYFRVKDHAGNLSSVVSDSIFLDLYPALPSSSSYQMCGGTVAAAAGSASSTSYQQHQGVMGVPGSGYSESTSYQLFVGVPQNCHAAANSQNNYLPLLIKP